ncbi:hypothetical protein K663_09470 [Sphingobium sp. MI1205]|nr:hypothetical protein K663_09470 [Sphingobium sp. MI1205]
MGGEEATGRPAGGAGQHPQDRNEEEVSAPARVAARRGGPKGKRRPPHSGSETTNEAIGPAQPWPDLRSYGKTQIRNGGFTDRRGCAAPPC